MRTTMRGDGVSKVLAATLVVVLVLVFVGTWGVLTSAGRRDEGKESASPSTVNSPPAQFHYLFEESETSEGTFSMRGGGGPLDPEDRVWEILPAAGTVERKWADFDQGERYGGVAGAATLHDESWRFPPDEFTLVEDEHGVQWITVRGVLEKRYEVVDRS